MDFRQANEMQWVLTDVAVGFRSLKHENEDGSYSVDSRINGDYYRLNNWFDFGLLIGAYIDHNLDRAKGLIPDDPYTMDKLLVEFNAWCKKREQEVGH